MHVREDVATLLNFFDRSQKSALEKYIRSPYFGIEPEVVVWLEEWLKNESLPESKKITAEFITHTKPGILKKIQEVCLDFLAQYQFDNIDAMKVNLNLEGIRKRNIDKLYKDTLSIIEKLPVTEFDQSSDYFFYRALIERNIFELKTENEKKNAKVKIASELNMHKISENIDLFYILENMKNIVHDYAMNSSETFMYTPASDIDFCLQAADEYSAKYPTVHLYAGFIKMLSQPNYNQTSWEKWQKLFETHFHKFPEKEQKLFQTAIDSFKKSNMI